MPQEYNDLHQSFGRCLKDREFIGKFYNRLLDSDPAIPPRFEHTDFSRQRTLLRRGISMAISCAEGNRLGVDAVTRMADMHSRKGSAPVPPEMHDHWLDCLLASISDSDPKDSPALQKRWHEAMDHSIDYFRRRY